MKKTILMCKSQHFSPIGITYSKPIPTYKLYTFWSVRAILHLYALVTSIHNHAAIMYGGTPYQQGYQYLLILRLS